MTKTFILVYLPKVIYKLSRNHLHVWIFKGLSVLLRGEWKLEYAEASKSS